MSNSPTNEELINKELDKLRSRLNNKTTFNYHSVKINLSSSLPPKVRDRNTSFTTDTTLGSGTYGEVSLARDLKKHDKSLVIKKHTLRTTKEQTHRDELLDKVVFEKSLREIQLLKSLNSHPNIVELKEVAIDQQSNTFLVYPFLDYDLSKLIFQNVNRNFTLSAIKSIFYQILKALEFLEQKNILHRDLKPANIMISKNGIVKIIDFGQSRYCDFMSSNKMLPLTHDNKELVKAINASDYVTIASLFGGPYSPNVCTAWYRCPEMYLESMNYDFKSDIWSAGVIFWEVIASTKGKDGRLFGSGDQESVRKKIFEIVGLGDAQKCNLLSAATRRLMRNNAIHHSTGIEKKIVSSLSSLNSFISGKTFPTTAPEQDETIEETRLRNHFTPLFEVEYQARDWIEESCDKDNLKDLILSMLRIDPDRRPSASDLLKHPFFTSGIAISTHLSAELPAPTSPTAFLSQPSTSQITKEFGSKLFHFSGRAAMDSFFQGANSVITPRSKK